jgi:hypothetical protein
MQRKRSPVKLPAEAFTICPSCLGADCLQKISLDVYCHRCGWDSSSAFVDAGGMDDLIYEYEMRLQRQSEQATAAQRRCKEKQKQQNMQRAV